MIVTWGLTFSKENMLLQFSMSFQSLAVSGSKKQLEHEVLVWCLKDVISDTDPASWKCHKWLETWGNIMTAQPQAATCGDEQKSGVEEVAYADAEMTWRFDCEGCWMWTALDSLWIAFQIRLKRCSQMLAVPFGPDFLEAGWRANGNFQEKN